MATVYAHTTDLAADPSQDPSEVDVDVTTDDGVTAEPMLVSGAPESEVGGTVLLPNFRIAGALAIIDDAVYVDDGDGTIGAASRFFPGSGGAEGYANESKVLKGQGGVSGAQASGILSLVTLPTADDTVTVGTNVYTFVAAPDAPGEVAIGADPAASNANLSKAINGDVFNTPHPSVFATSTAVSVTVTAINGGFAQNAIATTEVLTDLTDTWGAATLEGGSNSDQYRTSLEPVGVSSDVAVAMGL